MDGLDVGRELLAGSPNIRVIALTGREDPGVIREALGAGFHAFVSKGSPLSDLMGVIVASVEGSVLLPEVELDEGGAPETAGEQLLLNQLTARERQILTLLTEGLSTAGIAERLVVSRNTVRTHVQNIRSKLQVHSRLEAAAFARRHGISLAS
jgi:two-component system nitrate/nitrite response regulator NarL